MRRVLLILASLTVVFVLASGTASAQTQTCYPDCGEVGSEETGSTTTPTTAPSTSESEVASGGGGTLPLTGGDVAGLLVVGGGLLVAGGALVVAGRTFIAS